MWTSIEKPNYIPYPLQNAGYMNLSCIYIRYLYTLSERLGGRLGASYCSYEEEVGVEAVAVLI